MYATNAGTAAHGRDTGRSRLALLALVAGLAVSAAALHAVAGPPRPPHTIPGWRDIAIVLQGSYLPPEAITYPLSMLAWAAWLWTTALVVFRLAAVAAEAATHGAAWARSLRRASDRVTPLVLRRLVDGAVVATVVVGLAGRTVSAAEAAAPPAAALAAPVEWTERGDQHRQAAPAPAQAASRMASYTVRPGDNLWDIASRFYGSGYDYTRLIEANLARPMGDGRVFEATAVIHPGWVLQVPLPVDAVEDVDGATYYTVQPGDTLHGIAARVMGSEAEWRDLFEANRGVAALPDGRTLTQPATIWPGLRLRLPLPEPARETPAPAAAPVVPDEVATQAAAAGIEVAGTSTLDPAPPAPEHTSAPEATAAPASPVPDASEDTTGTTPPAVLEEGPVAAEPVSPAPRDLPHEDATPAGDSPAAGAAVLGMAAAVAGAAWIARRRVRRSLSEPPDAAEALDETAPAARTGAMRHGRAAAPPPGFAPTDLGREVVHRLHGGEIKPAALLAEQTVRFYAEHGVHDLAVISARYGESSSDRRERVRGAQAVSLTLSAGWPSHERLLELAYGLGERLGGTVEAATTVDHDVLLRLSGLRLLSVLPPATTGDAAPCLVPVGELGDGARLYANWREVGHVLVAGEPGSGTDVVLTSLLAALAGRLGPDRLSLWTLPGRQTVPDALCALPQQRCVAPRFPDGSGAAGVVGDFKAELLRRMDAARARAVAADGAEGGESDDRGAPGAAGPEPLGLLIIAELGDVQIEAATLELLGRHGPAHGMQVLAATTLPGTLDGDQVAQFGTRVVLALGDEATSIRLLGDPCAVELPEGHVALSLDGRRPVVARGLRTPDEHLDELVRLTGTAAGAGIARAASAEPITERDGQAYASLRIEAAGAAEPGAAGPGAAADGELAAGQMERTDEGGRGAAAPFEAPASPSFPRSPASEAGRPGGTNGAHAAPTGAIAALPPALPTANGAMNGRAHAATAVRELDAAAGAGAGAVVTLTAPAPDALPAAPVQPVPAAKDAEHANGVPRQERAETAAPSEIGTDTETQTPPSEDAPRSRAAEAAAVAAAGDADQEHEPAAAGPLLEVTCFGGTRVSSRGREVLPEGDEGGQYKAWELLAYLASHPDGSVTKEQLITALWPEMESEQGRNCMGVTNYRLRKVLMRQVPGLGQNVVSVDRNGVCRLDTSVVATDVHRFIACIEAARRLPAAEAAPALQEAHDLYQGDLLTGRGTGFYEWLHERDDGLSLLERYREDYYQATLRLAKHYQEHGEAARAVPLYRRLLQAEPTAEDVVRELFRCCEQLGDLGALTREAQHLRQALRQAYESYGGLSAEELEKRSQPQRQTLALFEEIRARLDGQLAPAAA